MASKLYKFDAVNHIHSIGNKIVPGITTLLNPLTDFSAVPAHILEAARQYGSGVHKAVELYCQDELDTDSLDVSLRPPVAGFEKWLKDYGFDHRDFIVELPMGDPALMVACIPDLILDGKLITEIKSRKPNHLTDSIQTCCQEHVWKKNGGIRTGEYERRVLYLAQDGTYTYTKVNDKQAMPRLRHLLDFYWFGEEIKKWK